MKTNITLKNIEVAGVKIGEVSITPEFSISELKGFKSIAQEFLKEMPEMLQDMKKAYIEYESITDELDDLDTINMKAIALQRDARHGKISVEQANKMIKDLNLKKSEIIKGLHHETESSKYEDTFLSQSYSEKDWFNGRPW